MELYKRIKELREDRHMSQEELALKTGYTSRTSIAKIEAGKIDLPQSKIVLFAKALDTTVSYLMGWEDTPSSANVSPAPADLDENIKKYLLLNAEGKKIAGDRIDELLELPKYRNSTSAPRNAHTEEQIAAAIKQITEDSSDVGSLLFNLSRSKK